MTINREGEFAGEIFACHGFGDGFQIRIAAETPGGHANTSQERPEETEAGWAPKPPKR